MLANDAILQKIEKKSLISSANMVFFKILKFHICDAAELVIIHNTV
jgi:hypothetical protein